MSVELENLFWNDKYKKEVEAIYEKKKALEEADGKTYPILQNNNFIKSPGDQPKSISCWANEKDGKLFVTHKIEDKKDFGGEKPSQNNYNQDDSMPF
mgnify:FL=1